jgi:hypothetical protein
VDMQKAKSVFDAVVHLPHAQRPEALDLGVICVLRSMSKPVRSSRSPWRVPNKSLRFLNVLIPRDCP